MRSKPMCWMTKAVAVSPGTTACEACNVAAWARDVSRSAGSIARWSGVRSITSVPSLTRTSEIASGWPRRYAHRLAAVMRTSTRFASNSSSAGHAPGASLAAMCTSCSVTTG